MVGRTFGGIRATDSSGPHWQRVLDLFEQGVPFELFDTEFYLPKAGHWVAVRVEHSWAVENINKANARRDLERGLHNFQKLCAKDDRFARIVSGRAVELELIHDDGMSSVALARMDESGEFKEWHVSGQ